MARRIVDRADVRAVSLRVAREATDALVIAPARGPAHREAVVLRIGEASSSIVGRVALTDDDRVTPFASRAAATAFAQLARDGTYAFVLHGEALARRAFPGAGANALAGAVSDGSLAIDERGVWRVLADYGPQLGTRVLWDRDVGHGAPLTARRADDFSEPTITILRDRAIVSFVRARAAAAEGAAPGFDVETVAMPANPMAVEQPAPRVDRSSRARPSLLRAFAFVADGRGYHDLLTIDGGTMRVRTAALEPNGTLSPGATVEIETLEPGTRVVDAAIGPLTAPCGRALASIRVRGASHDVELRRIGLAPRTLGVPVLRPTRADGRDARVRLVRTTGGELLAAWDGETGPVVTGITAAPDCSLRLRDVPVPAGLADTDLVDLSTDGARASLVARTRADGHVARIAIMNAQGSFADPRSERLPEVVDHAATLADAVVLGSRATRGIRLRRVEDVPDDAGGHDDLIVRFSTGQSFAMAGSAEHARLWTVDARLASAASGATLRSIVMHSNVAALEDGPRVETEVSYAPHLAFQSMDLAWSEQMTASSGPRAEGAPFDPHEARGRHFATWSQSRGDDTSADCAPGVFITPLDANASPRGAVSVSTFAAAATEPSHGASGVSRWFAAGVGGWPLVSAAIAACGDRAEAVSWRGAEFAAVVAPERAAPRLVVGDATSGVMRAVALARAERSAEFGAGVARFGEGFVVAWRARHAGRATIRVALFDAEGGRMTAPVEVRDVPHEGARRGLRIDANGNRWGILAEAADGVWFVPGRCE